MVDPSAVDPSATDAGAGSAQPATSSSGSAAQSEEAPEGASAGARRASALADVGSLEPLDVGEVYVPASDWPGYAASVAQAAESSRTSEAVSVWRARIADAPIILMAGEFEFLAGSLGRVAADRIVAAVRTATAEGLPVVALPTSGGTRMQEGTPAFVRMSAIAAAVGAHRAAGLPFLVWLGSPTFGGVMATIGSLGDVTFAEPEAQVGFLGPRVYLGVTGREFPSGIQTGEHLAEAGVIDGVRNAEQVREAFGHLLGAWAQRSAVSAGDAKASSDAAGTESANEPAAPPHRPWQWADLAATDSPSRPGVRELLTAMDPAWVELSGTQSGERDPQALIGVALLGQDDASGSAGIGCVVAGHDRSGPGEGITPAGLRTLARAAELAQRWGLALVNVVDTAGAELSAEAESGALAGEIARSLERLPGLDVPVVSIVLGAGCGGAAQALLPADIVLATEQAWVSPLPVEGASVIVHRTPEKAPQMAEVQHIGASELLDAGIVDRIVAPGIDPNADPGAFIEQVAQAVVSAVRDAVADVDPSETLAQRALRRSARFEQA